MFEPTHLESFLAVAQTRSFTEAGRRLGLQQSTISQHIRKLEVAAGRRLFVRDTHSVRADRGWRGDDRVRPVHPRRQRARAAISPARACAAGYASAPPRISSARGCPNCCASSSRSIALVDLELNVGAQRNAVRDTGCGGTRPGAGQAAGGGRSRPGGLARPAGLDRRARHPDRSGAPVPLILYTPPSITRSMALETLERHGRAWRIACTSSSLSGLRAAALAGLGITVHARGLIPDGLAEMKAHTACRSLPTWSSSWWVPRPAARPRCGAGPGHPGERRSAPAAVSGMRSLFT